MAFRRAPYSNKYGIINVIWKAWWCHNSVWWDILINYGATHPHSSTGRMIDRGKNFYKAYISDCVTKNFYWAPRRLCSARDTGVLCVRGKPLTSPGQWAACVPAATQRLWGDGAGCTGNRTPAAHGSATGPRTPVGRENSRWIKQSDGDRKTSWLLTSARLHNPPVATGRNTAVFGTFTKPQ